METGRSFRIRVYSFWRHIRVLKYLSKKEEFWNRIMGIFLFEIFAFDIERKPLIIKKI